MIKIFALIDISLHLIILINISLYFTFTSYYYIYYMPYVFFFPQILITSKTHVLLGLKTNVDDVCLTNYVITHTSL